MYAFRERSLWNNRLLALYVGELRKAGARVGETTVDVTDFKKLTVTEPVVKPFDNVFIKTEIDESDYIVMRSEPIELRQGSGGSACEFEATSESCNDVPDWVQDSMERSVDEKSFVAGNSAQELNPLGALSHA